MGKKSRRPLATLLAFTLVLALFAAMPIATSAANAEFLAYFINNYDPENGGGPGQLTAQAQGDKVYVKGSALNATRQLMLDMDSGITVVWTADLTGAAVIISNSNSRDPNAVAQETEAPLIFMDGAGTFEMNSGLICSTSQNGETIYAASVGATIIVNGGTIAADFAVAIRTYSGKAKVIVNDGEVISKNGENESRSAIFVGGDSSEVTVNGGLVSAEAKDGIAVDNSGNNSKVTVTGGEVRSGTGNAIDIRGANCSVEVSGGALNITGGATESNMNRCTIYIVGENATVNVSGGTVKNTASVPAIGSLGANVTINVSGGVLESSDSWGNSVIAAQGKNSTVNVSGGTIRAFGYMGGIYIINDSTVNVSGGMVTSWRCEAIASYVGTNNNVKVSGGFVFSSGSAAVIGAVCVITLSDVNAISIGSNAVVCGWAGDLSTGQSYTYIENTSRDLVVAPEGATAVWARVGSQNGIAYKNGTNEGFFPIEGITITDVAPTPESHIVTLDLNYSGGGASQESILSGEKIAKPLPDPTREGYTFEGWHTDAAATLPYDFDALVSSDFTLYAKWTAAVVEDNDDDEDNGEDEDAPSMYHFGMIQEYKINLFSDVDEDEWYGFNKYGYIALAYRYGLMMGDSGANTFRPKGTLSIAEAITMAVRVHSKYMTGTEASFPAANPWYEPYVEYAVENGIINAGDFADYGRAATRAEMAYIFSRSLPESEFGKQNTVNKLPDVALGTKYSAAIIMLYEAGVLAGNDDLGTFLPNDNITRAEAATIISRVVLPEMRFAGKVFG